MVLSSNWLELQNGKELGANKAKKGSKAVKIKKDENRHKKAVRSERKGSKIMNMVYTMSKEIQKAEEDKRTGKKFEFKKETVAEVPSADFIERPKLLANTWLLIVNLSVWGLRVKRTHLRESPW